MNILRESNPAAKKLNALRADITVLRKNIKTVQDAPRAAEDIQKNVRIGLKNRLRTDAPETDIGRLAYAQVDGRVMPLNDLSFGMLIEILGFDVVENRLCELAAKRLADQGREPGLTAAARAARIEELKQDIRAKEIAEIKEMLRLEELGFDVLPRSDTDVALMLEVWGEIGGPADEDLSGAQPAERPHHINDGAALHRAPD